MAIKPKKHKCKPCEKSHIEDIGTYHVGVYTYRNTDGNVYIDAYSVFAMLKGMGLDKQALAFMASVAEVRKKKE